MEPTKERLTKRLVAEIQDLPEDKLLMVLHFVERLGSTSDRPERGSAEAISRALDRVGPLQFEPGELDTLLADIERMREMDLKERG
jgi:hypothetical protein